jgi:hypothetical protein
LSLHLFDEVFMDASESPSGFQPNPQFRPNKQFRGRIAIQKKRDPGEGREWQTAFLLTDLPTTFPPIMFAGGKVWIRITTRTKIMRWTGDKAQEACLEDLQPSRSVEINLPTIFEGSVADLSKHFDGPSLGYRLLGWIRHLVGVLLRIRQMSDLKAAGQSPPVIVYPEWVLLHEDCPNESI